MSLIYNFSKNVFYEHKFSTKLPHFNFGLKCSQYLTTGHLAIEIYWFRFVFQKWRAEVGGIRPVFMCWSFIWHFHFFSASILWTAKVSKQNSIRFNSFLIFTSSVSVFRINQICNTSSVINVIIMICRRLTTIYLVTNACWYKK